MNLVDDPSPAWKLGPDDEPEDDPRPFVHNVLRLAVTSQVLLLSGYLALAMLFAVYDRTTIAGLLAFSTGLWAFTGMVLARPILNWLGHTIKLFVTPPPTETLRDEWLDN